MTRRLSARGRRAARTAVLGALGVLTLAGCGFIGDPPEAGMQITDDTDEFLGISVEGGTPSFTVRPGETHGYSLNGREGDCTEWRLSAVTSDGVVVAQVGSPVCSGDHWIITQAELDRARQDAGLEAPTPAPS